MFEPKFFRNKYTALKNVLATLLRLRLPPIIRRPWHCALLRPSLRPCLGVHHSSRKPFVLDCSLSTKLGVPSCGKCTPMSAFSYLQGDMDRRAATINFGTRKRSLPLLFQKTKNLLKFRCIFVILFTHFVIRNFRGFTLICRNAEEVLDQRKFGNLGLRICPLWCFAVMNCSVVGMSFILPYFSSQSNVFEF